MGRVWFVVAMVMAGAVFVQAASAQDVMRTVAVAMVEQIVGNPDVQRLQGKTVAVARFRNRGTDENLDVSALQDKVITALVKAKLFTVVEREQLNTALQQLKIDVASGLIDRNEQKELGKFLSADYLLIGVVSGDSLHPSVDARLMKIETGALVAAAEYPAENGRGGLPGDPGPAEPTPAAVKSTIQLISYNTSIFTLSSTADKEADAGSDAIRWLVDQRIFADAKDVLERWTPEITGKIYRSPARLVAKVTPRADAYYLDVNFAQMMRELVFIIFGKVTPRIAVDTSETILRRNPPDPAVKTVIEGAFLKYGFQVVDTDRAKMALLREALRQTEAGDSLAPNLVKQYLGEVQSDIIAVGDSFAEERAERDGFDARIEFKLVEVNTGRVLASIENTATLSRKDYPAVDVTSSVLGKLVLQRAAEGTTIRMCADILKSYGQPVYAVRVWHIGSLANKRTIEECLTEQLPGATVTTTSLDLRATNCALFSVMTKRTADQVAEALEKVPGLHVAVTGIDCRSIVCEIPVK